MRYYRFLSEGRGRNPPKAVTSAELGNALDIDPTQVRKDLGAIGLLGMGRVGFDACEVCRAIRVVLGFDRTHPAVLVGAGHLGTALVAYARFSQYGLRIVGVFDTDKRKIGGTVAGCRVRSARSMRPFITRHKVQLAILTTPVEAAEKVAERLVSAGIRAIWNFTPTRLTVPRGVFVRNEHISLGLSELAYHLTTSPPCKPHATPLPGWLPSAAEIPTENNDNPSAKKIADDLDKHGTAVEIAASR